MLYDANLKKLFEHAEQGLVYALDELWERYEGGIGVPKSKIKARECIEKILANPEYSKSFYKRFEAMYAGLGGYYRDEKRHQKALEFFLKAKSYIHENYPPEEHLTRINYLEIQEDIDELKHLLIDQAN